MSSYLIPPSEGFPSSLTVAGFPLLTRLEGSKRFPVPGHSEWQQMVLTFPSLNMVSVLWLTTESVAHGSAYNRNPQQGAAPVDLRVNGQIYPISPLSGLGFTDVNGWLRSQAHGVINQMDAYLRGRLATDSIDPWVTRYTGSSNMEFFHPVQLWAKEWGLSFEALRFLSRYRHIQDLRPRWWLGEYGVPLGFLDKDPPLANWRGEWWENALGLNAGDAQHYDLKELAVGYELTGWPSYLYSLINFWTFAEKNFASWRKVPGQVYSGSIRTPGWMLTASALLYDLLPADEPVYTELRRRVKVHIDWHLQNCIDRQMIWSPWYYGSPGQVFIDQQKNYQFIYQVAVLMWGCVEVAARVPELAGKAKSYAEWLGDWIDQYRRPGTNELGYVRSEDGTIVHYNHGPGTVWWPMAAMTRFEARYGKHWGYQDVVKAGMQQRGWWRQQSFEGVELAAPALGFQNTTW